MTLPLVNSVATVVADAVACLQAELPAVLAELQAQYETDYSAGIVLEEPASYWRTRTLPGGWTSPGVGVCEVRNEYRAEVRTTFDVSHLISATIVLDAGSAEADDLSTMEDALRLYGWAVAYTLQAYLANDAYGGAHGVYVVQPVDTTPLPAYQDVDRGQYLRAVQVQVRVDQRVRYAPLT